jgi:hypothetical protein
MSAFDPLQTFSASRVHSYFWAIWYGRRAMLHVGATTSSLQASFRRRIGSNEVSNAQEHAINADNRRYLLARAQEELRRAEEATNPAVGEVHRRMAHEYEIRANVHYVSGKAENDVVGATSSGDRSLSPAPDQPL